MATPSYSPIIGGTETIVATLAGGLAEAGASVNVLTFNMAAKWRARPHSTTSNEGTVRVFRQAALPLPTFRFRKKTVNPLELLLPIHLVPGWPAVDWSRYDILHFHDDVDLTLPLMALGQRMPKVFHIHSLSYTNWRYTYHALSRAALAHCADTFICCAETVRGMMVKLGFPDEKLRVLYGCVDTNKFRPPKEPPEGGRLLYVGRVCHAKGLDVLIRALRLVPGRVSLTIVGPADDAAYSSQVMSMIAEENGRGVHEILYEGLVDDARRRALLHEASVLVCPSRFDVFPTVNVEALACGVPVIGTRVGAIPEAVIDERSGLLVEPDSPTMLADAVQRLNDENLRMKLGRRGREVVEQRFSLRGAIEALTSLYSNLILAHGGQP